MPGPVDVLYSVVNFFEDSQHSVSRELRFLFILYFFSPLEKF
jgi:hypothetical protein